MGLAASQARFLGITARKSNIEYEGQQVNQQRTALAEEVNSLYSKLLSLEVPVAPDTTQFYETNYSFSISDTTHGKNGEYIIDNYFLGPDGVTYNISGSRTFDKLVAEQSTLFGSQWSIEGDDATGYTLVDGKNPTAAPYALTKVDDPAEMIELINSNPSLQHVDATQGLYYYLDEKKQPHYISEADVKSTTVGRNLTSYIQTEKSVKEAFYAEGATITFDDNGRMESINFAEYTGLEVDTTRTYNTEGYDAALRDYTMSKDEYDKMVADLNAQTETLQQEDKVLELRLNQIDTEQNELQTELEAVKSVLDKNIENTFKTFA